VTAELTVASFNIHWGYGSRSGRFPPFDVVGACRQLEPDVLLLLESWAPFDGPSSHAEVAADLGLTVAAFVPLAQSTVEGRPHILAKVTDVPRHPEATGLWGMALLTRTPAAAVTVSPLPSTWTDPVERALLGAEIAVGSGCVSFHGTHFAHYQYGSPLHRRPFQQALPDPSTAAVLLGDFNMWGWSVDLMVPPGWRRSVKGKTFPARRPQHQIDHLLVTPSVEVLHAEVLPDLGSDHRAIRARLRVP
jgi:endonuclease/exonuclease/phosphatase family metal-dependent hydrolase